MVGDGAPTIREMTLDLPDGPAPLADPSALRRRFEDVGYTVGDLSDLLLLSGELSGSESDLVVHLRRIEARPGPLADLVALFALGVPVTSERAAAALGDDLVAMLLDDGLLRRSGEHDLTSSVRVMPHGDVWIASDRWVHDGRDDDPLHVTGVNPPASLLARLTPRRRARAALDIGTGNGIQAMLAARHADRVVATDVNPRALAFARFNAALNAIDNVDFRLGSMFDPVEGERFDLVVCNPPYVISPESGLTYRDSGDRPGEMCRRIVGALPDVLDDDGFASVLVSWPMHGGGDWADRLRSWLRPGADAWLLKLDDNDPLSHAVEWHRTARLGNEEYGAALDAWTDYYAEESIERIDFGAVLLRAAPGAGRVVRADRVPNVVSSASDQIVRVFEAAQTDGDLLDRPVRLAPGHRFEQRLACDAGEWQLVHATLGLQEGIDLTVSLDPVMVQVVLGLDGSRTPRDAARRAADVAEVDGDERGGLEELTATMVRELVRRGIVVFDAAT